MRSATGGEGGIFAELRCELVATSDTPTVVVLLTDVVVRQHQCEGSHARRLSEVNTRNRDVIVGKYKIHFQSGSLGISKH